MRSSKATKRDEEKFVTFLLIFSRKNHDPFVLLALPPRREAGSLFFLAPPERRHRRGRRLLYRKAMR